MEARRSPGRRGRIPRQDPAAARLPATHQRMRPRAGGTRRGGRRSRPHRHPATGAPPRPGPGPPRAGSRRTGRPAGGSPRQRRRSAGSGPARAGASRPDGGAASARNAKGPRDPGRRARGRTRSSRRPWDTFPHAVTADPRAGGVGGEPDPSLHGQEADQDLPDPAPYAAIIMMKGIPSGARRPRDAARTTLQVVQPAQDARSGPSSTKPSSPSRRGARRLEEAELAGEAARIELLPRSAILPSSMRRCRCADAHRPEGRFRALVRPWCVRSGRAHDDAGRRDQDLSTATRKSGIAIRSSASPSRNPELGRAAGSGAWSTTRRKVGLPASSFPLVDDVPRRSPDEGFLPHRRGRGHHRHGTRAERGV